MHRYTAMVNSRRKPEGSVTIIFLVAASYHSLALPESRNRAYHCISLGMDHTASSPVAVKFMGSLSAQYILHHFGVSALVPVLAKMAQLLFSSNITAENLERPCSAINWAALVSPRASSSEAACLTFTRPLNSIRLHCSTVPRVIRFLNSMCSPTAFGTDFSNRADLDDATELHRAALASVILNDLILFTLLELAFNIGPSSGPSCPTSIGQLTSIGLHQSSVPLVILIVRCLSTILPISSL